MTHATLTMCLYLLASGPAPEVDATRYASSPAEDDTPAPWDGMLALLEQANAEADADPLNTVELLNVALEAFEALEADYADDPHALELRTLTQLRLARAQLAAEDELAASGTIQAAIRDQHGETLPAERLGPTLTRFYLEQRDLLLSNGRATVSLVHETPCEVVINGKLVDALPIELPLGTYRVHVRALDGSAENHLHVKLVAAGEVVTVTPATAAHNYVQADDFERVPARDWSERRALSGPEIKHIANAKRSGRVVLGIGGGMAGLGGVLLGVGLGAGAGTEGTGAVFAIGGTINLIIGGAIYGSGARRERRAKKKTRAGLVVPVLVFDRSGGRVGVSMSF